MLKVFADRATRVALLQGGQILRISVSLSALLKIPIRVKNIRGGREKPGLRAQHLKGLEVARDICQGKLWGCQLHSTEVVFHPNLLKGGQFTANTETAGFVYFSLLHIHDFVRAPLKCFSSNAKRNFAKKRCQI